MKFKVLINRQNCGESSGIYVLHTAIVKYTKVGDKVEIWYRGKNTSPYTLLDAWKVGASDYEKVVR